MVLSVKTWESCFWLQCVWLKAIRSIIFRILGRVIVLINTVIEQVYSPWHPHSPDISAFLGKVKRRELKWGRSETNVIKTAEISCLTQDQSFPFSFSQVNFYCGIFMLACISFESYLSVIHATQLYFQKRPWLAHISCILVWLGSLILSIADWYFTVAKKDYEQVECVHEYSVARLGHHTLGFLLPAVALIICCSFILLRLQRCSKGLQKQRSIMVILPLVGVFFLCWMPYNITLIVDTVRRISKEPDVGTLKGSLNTALMVTSMFGCIHACLRPLLYLGLCQNFRKQILALLRCAPVKSVGSLWELGVGEEVLPEQNHEVGERELMNVDHQEQLTQCWQQKWPPVTQWWPQ